MHVQLLAQCTAYGPYRTTNIVLTHIYFVHDIEGTYIASVYKSVYDSLNKAFTHTYIYVRESNILQIYVHFVSHSLCTACATSTHCR